MKVIDSSVEILEQPQGIVGMFKHIERVARIAYHTESSISEDSYSRFCDMLMKRGHWACFEHGTVYLKIPKFPSFVETIYFKNNPYTKFTEDLDYYYFTTNYREILHFCNKNKKDPKELLDKYWSEPDNINFKPRVTVRWICSRAVSHELVRHRLNSILQASQRYIAYDLEKNGAGISFIIPQWAYKLGEQLGENLEGEELWNELVKVNPVAEKRNKFWEDCEKEYLEERNYLKPEDARGVLCNDVMTEICTTGFVEDFTYKPEDTTEKAGFFYLRCAPDAHPDFSVLAKKLRKQFITKFYLGNYENIE